MTVRTLSLLLAAALPALPQTGKYGAYTGTVKVSGTETAGVRKNVRYAATIQITIPIDDSSTSSAILEIGDVDKPSAKVNVTQYDLDGRNNEPDSDGKITSWKCTLAGPVTVPAIAQGVLNVNYSGKTHSGYISTVTTEPVPMNCVNSRSGPYKHAEPLNFFFGTNEPDVVPYTELPFADAARLTAKFTLVPKSAMKGKFGPQTQEWEFIRRK